VANQTRHFKKQELREIDPVNNKGITLVPQILANDPDLFLDALRRLGSLGYRSVDLNLGCPMPTVVSKRKGAGMLRDPDKLDAFLDGIFSGLQPQDPAISIKTRIGFEDASEGIRRMTIFNRYPITRLTIHARRQIDYYKGKPDLETFGTMLAASKHPVCYNGDLFSAEDVEAFNRRFPQADALMIGRGLLRDPALVRTLQGGAPASMEELHAYVRALFDAYSESSYGPANAVQRMKELWSYLITQFTEAGRTKKTLLRAASVQAYETAVEELF
jgi:tRNA-dihydrouridine synthase